ncbi:unnamed protein product [Paramecium primaurelia]|uniref:Uncharacterized protein n=1 Tax=Paramecium primaurelia TaxID=5886 RepID=A0A8S1K440_PARPR|nr:unnamed protein product [Paramecium primaurelia]
MNYKLTEPLQSQFSNLENVGQFKTQKVKIRVLNGYSNQIIVVNKNKFISLTFKTKFQLLREHFNEKYKVGKPLGLLIERENNQHIIILFSDDVQMLQNWRDYLAKHINQRGFHESFKAHRIIGKGIFTSVDLEDRLEDERSLAIKAFSKEVAYEKEKGKVYLQKFPLHGTDLLEGGSLYDNVKIDHNLMHLKLKCLFLVYWKDFVICIKKVLCIEIQNQKIFYIYALLIFGLAQHSDKYPYLFNRCGTPGFLIPEVINSKDGGRYEPICDINSTGKPVFPGNSYNVVLGKNRKCEISFDATLFEIILEQAYIKESPLTNIFNSPSAQRNDQQQWGQLQRKKQLIK